MNKKIFITSILSCMYSVLSVFAWNGIPTNDLDVMVRVVWWVGTVVLSIAVLISVVQWGSSDN